MLYLADNYYIDITRYGVTLQMAAGQDKNGETIYRPLGYYSDIEQAVEACVNKRISRRISDGMHGLEDGLAIIREERARMADVFKKAVRFDRELIKIRGETYGGNWRGIHRPGTGQR